MAIDGVKIIDSDSAYDIYNEIMDMYHYGETIDAIKAKISGWEKEFCSNDIEKEIYFTTYALAMWEIGALEESLLNKVREIVTKWASAQWNKIEKDAREKRQKELEKLLLKIEKSNEKIKKRKNYKRITDLIFQPNDVLVFQFNKSEYGATMLIKTFENRGKLYYQFIEIIWRMKKKPTIEDIISSQVFVRKGIGFCNAKTISHKDLLKCSNKFEKIENLEIRKEHQEVAILYYINTFEEFIDDRNRNWGHSPSKAYDLIDFL